MQKLRIKTLFATVVLAATQAHAATGVLDFEGFTIAYDGSGKWDSVSGSYGYTRFAADTSMDLWTFRQTTTGGGVEFSEYGVSFGTSGAYELQSRDGLGNGTLNSFFSYTVTAKPGWQLTQVIAQQHDDDLANVAANGGVVSVSGSATGSATNGRLAAPVGYAYVLPEVGAASGNGNRWASDYSLLVDGNRPLRDERFTFHGNGLAPTNDVHFTLSDQPPLMSTSGSFSQLLSVSTSSPSQIATLSGFANPFSLGISAARTVSPVPEPDTYAMVAASLGLMGFLARRRRKNPPG